MSYILSFKKEESHPDVYSRFAGLSFIARLSKLTSLKLALCLNITDKGVSHVGFGCSKLNELDLYRFFLYHFSLIEFFNLTQKTKNNDNLRCVGAQTSRIREFRRSPKAVPILR